MVGLGIVPACCARGQLFHALLCLLEERISEPLVICLTLESHPDHIHTSIIIIYIYLYHLGPQYQLTSFASYKIVHHWHFPVTATPSHGANRSHGAGRSPVRGLPLAAGSPGGSGGSGGLGGSGSDVSPFRQNLGVDMGEPKAT